ncbi:MAG: FAD:protein FMN transferase [Pseudomonadota bacterium]|nr:FAD:protein FMN transferase [Pseudomonadota bacterium]
MMIANTRHQSLTALGLMVMFALVLLAFKKDKERLSLEGLTMGTSYKIQLLEVPGEEDPGVLADKVQTILSRLDREIFSTYAPNSELSRLNNHAVGTPFAVSREMLDVLMLARTVFSSTSGAFDPTVGPLVSLWGFGPKMSLTELNLPCSSDVEEALSRVGFEHLLIDEASSEVVKTRDVMIDLSAIAKGYAVDQIGRLLDEQGSDSYFIEIGGELKIKGVKADGSNWVPAIEAPSDRAFEVYEIFSNLGQSIAVAGSGDYRNYFEVDGVRYSHEIDPRTGRPVRHHLAAAYVIADSAALADALATAYMVMGEEFAFVHAEERGIAVFLIAREGDDFAERVSSAFRPYLAEQ